ncbi:MAG: DUF1989 domain-containing protein [Geminicoccaceae bacterium]
MAVSSIVSPLRPKIIEPGMLALDPGVERYQVKGGGAIVVALEPGDRLEISDVEGRQQGELIVFSPDGKSDAGALSAKATRVPRGIQAILGRNTEDSMRVRAGLERHGLDLGRVKAVPLFTPYSPAGESADFTASRPVICAIAAPGEAMSVHDQLPPTDLLTFVTRANLKSASRPRLPEALAAPRLDFRVGVASALNYEVKAGEYIQIIDVEGRQCSDFLAFVRRDLDAGRVNGLDSTTTRTLMGAAYPGPGLFSKFFSMDMQGLVEVVQDTVGRHDTFNLACTSRYYEDMGYFGHANCSDNFNGVLKPFEIDDRKGWPAINFFFNTFLDDQSVIHFDQPWSRPGDHILLRALTDLVCASSSCPCDVDAANGWTLSEIHVRVYPSDCFFKKAVAYRMTPDAPAQLTKETGFHDRTSALTKSFTEYRGYWLPTSFDNHGAIDEYWACRERAVIMDLSPLRKFEVLGPDAESLMQTTFTRNVYKLAVGQIAYGAMCYEHGGMIDDGTLFRLGDDNFRWIGGDDYGGIWLREQAEKLGLKVWIKSATDQIHNVAVQGPKSRDILKELVWTPSAQPSLEELGWFRFAVGRLDDFHGRPIMVSRTGYTGELGYEIWCHPDDASLVWNKVMAAGAPYGITPLGLDALDILRVEAGLIFAGYEFDDQTDPFEAGIGFSVALKHNGDFIGRAALEKRKTSPQRTLVGLELVGNEQALPGDCVHIGRAHIGDVTSACRSPILKKAIALARINTEYADLGTEVEIGKLDGHQKRLPATMVRFPFYDPEKSRVRA